MKRASGHTLMSIVIMIIGFALMVYMIVVESEPGALPLLLVLIGMSWFFITLYRSKHSTRS
jgi:fatty acid desaturase